GLAAATVPADGLEGRTLTRIDQAENALELVVLRIGLDGEDKVDGEIASVTVTASNERAVQLGIAYRGFQGAEFAFEVQDTGKRGIPRIPEARYVVPEAAAGAEQTAVVGLALGDRTEEGF